MEGQIGAEVAEYLATKGSDATIVEMLDQSAIDSPLSVRPLLLLSLCLALNQLEYLLLT